MEAAFDAFWPAHPLIFASLVALVFLPLEHRLPARPARHRRRAWAADLAFATAGAWLARAASIVAVGAALAALDRLAPDEPLFAGVHDGPMGTGLDVACGLALFELGGHGYHRLARRVPWLWRLHQVHHASEPLDRPSVLRQHPLELLLTALAQNALLVLAGIPLGAYTIIVVLLKIATVFVQAEPRVPDGPWDWFVGRRYRVETAAAFGSKPATSARASTMLSSIEQ